MAQAHECAAFHVPWLDRKAGSTTTFPSLLGHQAASWMLYSSAWMDAEACKAAGLVLDVFADDALADEVMQRAQTIAAQPLSALLHSKALLMGPRRDGFGRQSARRMRCTLN